MTKKVNVSILMLASVIVLARGFLFFVEGPEPTVAKESNPTELSRVLSPSFPENLAFAGEVVPVNDVDVRERFDRELLVNTYWHSNTVLSLKRANRYFPIISSILKKNGVPDDFKYLALIESGLTNVVSPAGASGFWQIMKATGIQYGLEISTEIDERYHIEKATEAACVYLKEAKSKFGSWTAAAASYNMGMAGLQKQMNRQNASDYYDLLLNSETSRYMFRILAVKVIFENPENFGFYLKDKDLYSPVPETTVSLSLPVEDLADFALANNISYKALKIHNPWLRQSHLKSGKKAIYEVKIPDPSYYGNAATPIQKELRTDPNNSDDEDVGD